MNFYKVLSKYYDEIFPLKTDTLNFINEEFSTGDVILDLACGTGIYSLKISDDRKKVYATDLCDEMVKIGENKVSKSSIEFFNEDMRNINVVFKDVIFDGIFCIGNSIVHLDSKWDIKDVIKKAYELLRKKGVFIIEIINYDRILKNNVKELPSIYNEDKNIKFLRTYDIDNNKIFKFNSVIIVDKNKIENEVEILPIGKDELYNMVQDIGYSKIEVFGDYMNTEWSLDSYHTIIKAYK